MAKNKRPAQRERVENNKKLRLYGIINDGTFNIIWYDKKHKIYLSKKKHT
ncbi:hypothetical protein [Clostridium sp.]|nr:hypothetical protein [Clostridium sp.]